MSYPEVIVEISFASTPYTASPSWIDVTEYVREVTVRRGRSDEFQEFDPSTATVTLDNRTRRFDPLNTSSPYAPNVIPRRAIAITAKNTIGGTDTYFPVFRGFVEGWPVSITDAGYDSTVTIECVDVMGLLAQEELPDDLADNYIRSLSPRHYWPLNDPIDPVTYTSQTLADYGSSPIPLTPYGTFKTSNCDGLAIGLANTAVSIAETDFVDAWSFRAPAFKPTSGFATFSTWFQGPQLDVMNVGSFGMWFGTNISYTNSTSTLLVQIVTAGGLTEYTGTIALDLSISHHIAVIKDQDSSAAPTVYIDGQALSVSLSASYISSNTLYEEYSSGQGRRQQVVIFDTALTETQIQTIYRLSRAIITETSAARFQRLIDYSPLVAGMYLTPTDTVATVSGITTGGPSITSELQLLNDSEGGNLYVNKDGKIVMTGRNAFATGTSVTSQATIGTTGITIGPEIQYRVDAETMRNALTMGFAGDGVVEVVDQDSVDFYGTSGGTWTTQLSTQQDAETLGNLLIGFSSLPKVVVNPVEVNVAADASSWATILGLELLDRITLVLAPYVGSSISLPQLVQSIEHRIIPGQWSTTLNGSVRWTNPFILDSSLLDGPDLLI